MSEQIEKEKPIKRAPASFAKRIVCDKAIMRSSGVGFNQTPEPKRVHEAGSVDEDFDEEGD